MPITTTPFTEVHLDEAAALLADRPQRDRERQPALPAAFSDPATTRPLLAGLLADPTPRGVAALDSGGRLAGYLFGGMGLPAPTMRFAGFVRPRFGRIGYADHAARAGEELDVYRALYAALAPGWVERGLFTHYIEASATDEAALAAWFSLGFGQDLALAVRDSGPVAGASDAVTGLEFHQAGPEDMGVVWPLLEALARHHASSPIFLPDLPETHMEQRAYQQHLLEDPAAAHWLAYRDGTAVALQTFMAPNVPPLALPERSVYLYQGITDAAARGAGVGAALLDRSLAWAREAGYERCLLHFFTANLAGARFWLGQGFQPLSYRLHRQIDERISWANAV
jgi:GNAT superfamily N-acetyltransferase